MLAINMVLILRSWGWIQAVGAAHGSWPQFGLSWCWVGTWILGKRLWNLCERATGPLPRHSTLKSILWPAKIWFLFFFGGIRGLWVLYSKILLSHPILGSWVPSRPRFYLMSGLTRHAVAESGNNFEWLLGYHVNFVDVLFKYCIENKWIYIQYVIYNWKEMWVCSICSSKKKGLFLWSSTAAAMAGGDSDVEEVPLTTVLRQPVPWLSHI